MTCISTTFFLFRNSLSMSCSVCIDRPAAKCDHCGYASCHKCTEKWCLQACSAQCMSCKVPLTYKQMPQVFWSRFELAKREKEWQTQLSLLSETQEHICNIRKKLALNNEVSQLNKLNKISKDLRRKEMQNIRKRNRRVVQLEVEYNMTQRTYDDVDIDSKKCPTCSTRIFKTGGCDHMKCTVCNSHFQWTTLRLMRMQPIIPELCGGLPEPSSFSGPETDKTLFWQHYEAVVHIRDRVLPAIDISEPNADTHRDLRISLINRQISKFTLLQTIRKRNAKRDYRINIYDKALAFVLSSEDIYQRYSNDPASPVMSELIGLFKVFSATSLFTSMPFKGLRKVTSYLQTLNSDEERSVRLSQVSTQGLPRSPTASTATTAVAYDTY